MAARHTEVAARSEAARNSAETHKSHGRMPAEESLRVAPVLCDLLSEGCVRLCGVCTKLLLCLLWSSCPLSWLLSLSLSFIMSPSLPASLSVNLFMKDMVMAFGYTVDVLKLWIVIERVLGPKPSASNGRCSMQIWTVDDSYERRE